MERIGIFGGTFDPVHNEHIRLARLAAKELKLDKLIIVPTYAPPHKNAPHASSEDRLRMLNVAFADDDGVEVSDFEIVEGGKSYTYLTVTRFKEIYPDAELFFLVGGDMINDFFTWRNPDVILSYCTLAAFKRDGVTNSGDLHRRFIEKFGKDFIELSQSGADNSSTKIRVYSALGLDITEMTDKRVADYIRSVGLYKGDVYADFVQSVLPHKRLVHTANVVVCALKKVKELKLDERQVYTAAILHDCAKYADPEATEGFVLPSNVPRPVVHAFLGAYVAEKFLGVKNTEVIDAIRYHTSGKAEMTLLGKLIFVADMIEEGRSYEGVDKLRALYEGDFERCFKECLKEEYLHLQNKGGDIYVETENAYSYYIKNAY